MTIATSLSLYDRSSFSRAFAFLQDRGPTSALSLSSRDSGAMVT